MKKTAMTRIVRDGSLEIDDEGREVRPPADFVKALTAAPPAWDRWCDLSYSHQREHVEAIVEAKKPETRVRRIAHSVEMIAARPAKKRPKR